MSQIVTLAAGDVIRLKRAMAGNAAFSFGVVGSTSSSASVAINFSAGVSSDNLASVTFSDSNNVSFGLSNGVITAIANTVGGGAITNMRFSAGTYSTYRSDLTFGDSNGVSFGQDTNGVITATVATNYQSQGAYLTTAQPPGAYLTTAMQSDASSAFAGKGFTTATTAGTNIVGTLDTNGLSMGVPAYLTTAAAGSGAGTGFTTATTAGTDVVGTLDTNGLSLGVPAYLTTAQSVGAYLTTAMASNASTAFAGTGATIAGGSLTVNTAGVNISLPAYLTTAMASDAGSNFAGTNGSMAGGSFTLNTSGATISLPAYLTTAMASNASSAFAGTGATIAGGSMTVNTAGVNISLPAYLTTFSYPRLDQVLDPAADKVFSMGSNQLQLSWATGGSFSTNATRQGFFELDVAGNLTQEADVIHAHQHGGAPTLLDIVHVEGDGANVTGLRLQMAATVAAEVNMPIKFTTRDTQYSIGSVPMILGSGMSNVVANLNANYLQGSAASQFQSAGAYLTTAQPVGNYAGTATSVVTTGGTDLSMALNTGGLTVAYPKWITTYVNDLTSGRAGVNASVATTGGTDLTLGVNTSGVTIGYPKWITTYVNDLTSARAGTNTSVATTSGTDLSIAVNTSGVTVAYPKWITTYVAGGGATLSLWQNRPAFLEANSTVLNTGISVLHVQPITLPQAVSFGFLRLPISMSQVSTESAGTTANTSYTYNRSYTIAAVFHTQNAGASSLSLASYISSYASFVFQHSISAGAQGSRYSVSQNVTYPTFGTTSVYNTSSAQSSANVGISTNNFSQFTGLRWLDIPWATSLSAGNYWLALGYSSNSATNAGANFSGASMAFSYIGVSQSNVTFGRMGEATASSVQGIVGMGSWSTNSAIMSSGSLQLASISQISSQPEMFIQLQRFA